MLIIKLTVQSGKHALGNALGYTVLIDVIRQAAALALVAQITGFHQNGRHIRIIYDGEITGTASLILRAGLLYQSRVDTPAA